MPVLAAYSDPEDKPPGSELVDIGELAGDQDGMAQRQQVHAAVDRQGGMKHRQGGRLYEPVESEAGEEAHMVCAADMVNAGRADLLQERPRGMRVMLKQAEGREHADTGRNGRPAGCA